MARTSDPELLETDRLILRTSVDSDAVVFRRLWTERDERVPPHRRIDADGRPTPEDIEAHLRRERERRGPHLLTVERKDNGDVIGYCGLNPPGSGQDDEAELAYELLRAAHGPGYATEAARAVVARARAAGYCRLWAGVWAWNVASRRVLEKLGFRQTDQVTTDPVRGDNLLTVLEL